MCLITVSNWLLDLSTAKCQHGQLCLIRENSVDIPESSAICFQCKYLKIKGFITGNVRSASMLVADPCSTPEELYTNFFHFMKLFG